MLEAETESGDYWRKCGEEALAHGVKGVILMVRFCYPVSCPPYSNIFILGCTLGEFLTLFELAGQFLRSLGMFR